MKRYVIKSNTFNSYIGNVIVDINYEIALSFTKNIKKAINYDTLSKAVDDMNFISFEYDNENKYDFKIENIQVEENIKEKEIENLIQQGNEFKHNLIEVYKNIKGINLTSFKFDCISPLQNIINELEKINLN